MMGKKNLVVGPDKSNMSRNCRALLRGESGQLNSKRREAFHNIIQSCEGLESSTKVSLTIFLNVFVIPW